MTPHLLSQIEAPQDVRRLSCAQQEELCAQIRRVLIDTVSQNGGHLSSNLGVVELTVALHSELNFPKDTLLFDVGHQCYTHKLLTGRYQDFSSLRQKDGISGFPNPSESEYDAFIMGHSSTSISAACGIAAAKRLKGDDSFTVAVIGDGALTGGLAYEGLSNVAGEKSGIIVVLNDNRMSISQNVGFVARHLTWLRSRSKYIRFKNGFAYCISRIPLVGQWLYRKTFRLKTGLKTVLYRGSSMFEDMGLYYFGPIDGHDLQAVKRAVRIAKKLQRPVLIHAVTEKGKGYDHAVKHPDTYHGVSPFDKTTGQTCATAQTFSSVFGQTLTELAEQQPYLCAVTAAMTAGTGLESFAARFPQRFFDVGIAEQHAVTFSSALASQGMTPVVALYSSFLQRAYDQILNDTAIMNNHVILAIDRAGTVAYDGETHQGLFDPAFLRAVPHMRIDAPATFEELRLMLRRDILEEKGLLAVRYSRGGEVSLPDYTPNGEAYTVFTQQQPSSVLLVTYGTLTAVALQVRQRLQQEGKTVDILKLNRIWPLSEDGIQVACRYQTAVFLEEGCVSGISEAFGAALMQSGACCRYRVRAVKEWIPCCSKEDIMRLVGLDAESVYKIFKEEGTECGLPL